MVPQRIEREIIIEAPVDLVWSIVTEAELRDYVATQSVRR
jgi:hypothetical protein